MIRLHSSILSHTNISQQLEFGYPNHKIIPDMYDKFSTLAIWQFHFNIYIYITVCILGLKILHVITPENLQTAFSD